MHCAPAGSCAHVQPDEWFLTAAQRGNPATRLDARHHDGSSWSRGNDVRPLIHGSSYFAELAARVGQMSAGDLLLFTDWRGDPDERLRQDGPAVSDAFCEAARRGVRVAGLIWRSHLDRLRFSAEQNRHLGEDIEAAGGQCLLDMRVRPGGSHHMKMVVLRHRSDLARDAAFVGGIDLCHSRRDDLSHAGDPQAQQMAPAYGPCPPWHDVQALIQGPAVGDVEAVFRERWDDPAPLTRNPLHRLRDLLDGDQRKARPLPPQLPDPPARGPHAVQILRTYPYRRHGYDFAPAGERSIARAYEKVLPRSRSLVYIEDQYLWSAEIVAALAAGLRANPGLHVIAVIPRYPDQDGRVATPLNLVGRADALRLLREAGGDRVAAYGLENVHGTPVYVHAKVCLVDDAWAVVGSANVNRRSWTHDSELCCAVVTEDNSGAPAFARQVRELLAAEHLGLPPGAGVPAGPQMFAAFRSAAALLDAWHDGGRIGPRPPGQLRSYPALRLSAWTRTWAAVPYRIIYDPDGRPRSLRAAGQF
jgi:phosphatidylserine/phosphatidylglycerophosphate/cardiolipin synthase-like enzyme